LVMLSVALPLSDAAARSGALGAAAAVSMVTVRLVDAALTLPATSVCFGAGVCAPSAHTGLAMLQLPLSAALLLRSLFVLLVSYRVALPPGSAPLPFTTVFRSLVMLSVALPLSDAAARSGALGAAAAVSMVTVRLVDAALTLPATSVCF